MKTFFPILKNLFAIIGLLSVSLFTLYHLSSAPMHKCKSTHDVKVRADMIVIAGQLELFERDHGVFPNSLEDLVGEYRSQVPRDPWGEEYKYEIKSGSLLIYTYDQKRSNEKYSIRVEYNF